jgi:alpha-N-arabinofuranosidase
MNWTPMLAVNLGTGAPEEARNWVEYCNSPAGTRYSNLRAANGHMEPHGVKLWCLGNEMDGPWQIGHVPAGEYAIRAQQAAKMMKDVDRSIELVACGSCSMDLPTYLEWDRQVLEYLGDQAEYISMHRYVGNPDGDTPNYLAVTNSIDQQIEGMDAICRYVQAKQRLRRRTFLCFDEWNVWYKNQEMDGAGQRAPHLIEEVYNLEDALVVAGFLNSFIRHADAVKIANLAQVVNAIAPILTRGDDLLIQSIYYPFKMFADRRDGIALRVATQGPSYESRSYGSVTVIDSSAILDGDRVHLFLVNRSTDEAAPVEVQVGDRTIVEAIGGELLTAPGAGCANSFEQPDLVRSQPWAEGQIVGGQAVFELPALSMAAVTLRLAAR